MKWTLRVLAPNGPSTTEFKALASSLDAAGDVCVELRLPVLQVEDPEGILDRAMIHRVALGHGVDVLIENQPVSRCKLLVADMEATIIQDEMLDLLAEERGIGEAVARITAQAMAGELDFAQSLIARTRLLAGTQVSHLQALCARIRYMPGARALVKTMCDSGAKTVLVTGGYDIFAQEVARHCGFDDLVANRPEIRDGVMTGALHQPICTAATKRDELLLRCESLGIAPQSACCVGDGANDALMLQACGLAVSYKGKPVVQDIVDLNITSGDLTAVLSAQGFTTQQIVRT